MSTFHSRRLGGFICDGSGIAKNDAVATIPSNRFGLFLVRYRAQKHRAPYRQLVSNSIRVRLREVRSSPIFSLRNGAQVK
ncbi:hypothetical protein RB10672 [Rhodopirellula baltica SH 1]|uniref:Uncharacterized protein n=1 Tax=Rhodopirellula baltica (strain DSM 10527 / NCIMB 13988 / SH1) TaxID=243090 RepID=Q7UKF6_RHOBA|nr:hypothetical protein RB10672 [Rhodopirellula baltica SH 1]